MIVRPAVDRAEEGELVDLSGEMRKELRYLDAALSVPLEAEGARHERAGKSLADDDASLDFVVEGLARVFRQRGLGIERVHLAHAAAHKQRDHRSGPRAEKSLADDDASLDFVVEGLARVFRQRGLGIERVHLAHAAAHKQRDHRSGPRAEVRRFRREGVAGNGSVARGARLRFGVEQAVAVEKMRQSESRDPTAGAEQELSPVPEPFLHRVTSDRGTR